MWRSCRIGGIAIGYRGVRGGIPAAVVLQMHRD